MLYVRQCQQTELALRDTINNQLTVLRSAGLQNQRDYATINEQQQQIVNLHESMRRTNTERAQSEQELRQQLVEAHGQLRESRASCATIETKLRDREDDLSRTQDIFERNNIELTQMRKGFRWQWQSIKSLVSFLDRIPKDGHSITTNIDELIKDNTDKSLRIDELEEKIDELHKEAAENEEEVEAQIENREASDREIDRLNQVVENLKARDDRHLQGIQGRSGGPQPGQAYISHHEPSWDRRVMNTGMASAS